MTEHQDKKAPRMDRYGTVCSILNYSVVVLLTIASGVILFLVGVPLLVTILVSVGLLVVFAWIVERYISIFINTLVAKVMKGKFD